MGGVSYGIYFLHTLEKSKGNKKIMYETVQN